MLTPPELSAWHIPSMGARPTVLPRKVRPLRVERSVTGWGQELPPPGGTCEEIGGTHVSSCVESCGSRAHSIWCHCRKAQSVAFASGVTGLWSCLVHTSRPVSAT